MKTLIIGMLTLISFHLNAQVMTNPNDVITSLFNSTDQHLWEQVETTFSSNVRLDYSSMNGQPAANLTPKQITDAWKSILPGFEHTHHQIGNITSKIDGDNAEVFCYGTATHYLTDDLGNIWTVVGTYHFDLSKQANQTWKITSMTFNFKYQDGNSTLPEKAINALKS